MRINGTRWALTCLCAAIATIPAVYAQQQSNTSSPYQGVSTPPPDDSIVANQETQDTSAPPPAVTPRPSPSVPAAATPTAPPPPAVSHPRVSSDAQYDNTDYGIVTVPLAPGHDNPQSDVEAPALHTRKTYNADNDIVNPQLPANELAQGTEIRVRIGDSLSTESTSVGSPFHGQVMFDVVQNGTVIIPAGSILRGRVTQVSQGHHFGPAATLRLRPDVIILPDGTAYHLYAQVMSSWADGTRTGSEGAIEPSSHAVKKTAEYGVGVGTGALVGAELAGPAGALAGSLVGAGLVTTHLLTQHPNAAQVPTGSEIIFSLTEPMDLTPTRN